MTCRRVLYSLSLITSVVSTPLFAAGYAVQEQSVSSLGNAFSGFAVVAEDASTVFGNAAGLTYLDKREFVVGAHLIIPIAEFNDDGSTYYNGDALPGEDGETSAVAVVPNMYVAWPLNEKYTVGFGVNAPFGLTTDYGEDWQGRYHATKSELTVINFNPTVGVKVDDKWSLGFGVSAYYGGVRLQNKVDVAGAVDESNIGQGDVDADFGGTGWGYGFQLGAIFQPTDALRLGFNYRSKTSLTFEGEADFDVPDTLPDSQQAQFADGGIEASTDLPEHISFSAMYDVNSKWQMLGDISYVKWSRFTELRIEYDDGRADSVQPEDWDNSWRFATGARYHHGDGWLFRGGLAYEQTPVPSAEKRTPRIPDDNRLWLTFGLNKTFTSALSADFAYGLVMAGDTEIDNEDEVTGHNLQGSYDSTVHILSAQINWQF